MLCPLSLSELCCVTLQRLHLLECALSGLPRDLDWLGTGSSTWVCEPWFPWTFEERLGWCHFRWLIIFTEQGLWCCDATASATPVSQISYRTGRDPGHGQLHLPNATICLGFYLQEGMGGYGWSQSIQQFSILKTEGKVIGARRRLDWNIIVLLDNLMIWQIVSATPWA